MAIEAVRRFEHCKGDLRIMPKALHHMTLEELSNSFHNPDTVKVDSARAVRAQVDTGQGSSDALLNG